MQHLPHEILIVSIPNVIKAVLRGTPIKVFIGFCILIILCHTGIQLLQDLLIRLCRQLLPHSMHMLGHPRSCSAKYVHDHCCVKPVGLQREDATLTPCI